MNTRLMLSQKKLLSAVPWGLPVRCVGVTERCRKGKKMGMKKTKTKEYKINA